MDDIMRSTKVAEFLAEMGAVVGTNNIWETPIIKPGKKYTKNMSSSRGSKTFGEGKARETIDHNEPILARKVK